MTGHRAAGVLAVLLAAGAARAADPAPPPNARATRAAAEWRKLGARAMPAVMRAYCSRDWPVRHAAEQELRRQGLAAVEPLLRFDGETCDGSRLAGEVLCRVSPLDDGALRALLSRLAPLVAAPKKRAAVAPLWSMLTSMYPAINEPHPPRACPNRDQVARASLDVLLTPDAVARVAPANRLPFALIFPALLSAHRTSRGAFVPMLARWLDERSEASQVVVQAVAATGPDGAPAVPALRAYLVRELDRAQQPTTRDYVSASLSNVAKAAAAVGNEARPMLGELRGALAATAGRMCDWNRSDEAGTILEAIGTLDGSAWESVRATVETAWQRGANCAEASGLDLGGNPGVWGRERLMDGVGVFGPAAASFQALLRPVLADTRASFETRGRAARALRKIGARLVARDGAQAKLLEARVARLERERPAAVWQRRAAEQPEAVAGLGALDAIAACMADANVTGPALPPVGDMGAFSYDENHAFVRCVSDRICGPGADVLAETLATCCNYAYARARPDFCIRR